MYKYVIVVQKNKFNHNKVNAASDKLYIWIANNSTIKQIREYKY